MTLHLIDTSVWIHHFRSSAPELVDLLSQRRVLIHSAVMGELACGNLPSRNQVISDLQLLPKAKEAEPEEVLKLLNERQLYGKGLGWVDLQLLASALLSDAILFTYDKRLAAIDSHLRS
jgi:predicted nucleic acid-binding protein